MKNSTEANLMNVGFCYCGKYVSPVFLSSSVLLGNVLDDNVDER